MKFVVMGKPAPQGSKRAFYNPKAGRAVVVENSAAVRPWRSAVADRASTEVALRHAGMPFEGPVALHLTFYWPRPKAHLNSKGDVKAGAPPFPVTKPDLDKLVRATCDGLTDGGLYKDDSQVVTCDAAKRYCNGEHPTPCAVVAATEVPPWH